jgi:hypothetical protein
MPVLGTVGSSSSVLELIGGRGSISALESKSELESSKKILNSFN